jgi:hypothetical protein
MMRRVPGLWLVALALGAISLNTAQSSDQEPPARVVERFYGIYLKLGVSGLPGEKQFESLKPFLDADLNKILTAARRKQAEAIKRHPGEKPPWGDGDLFSSLFEGAQRYKVGEAAVHGRRATVPVQLEYRDSRSDTRWTDTFVLLLERGEWRISDVKMGGQWPFRQGATLRKVLSAQ